MYFVKIRLRNSARRRYLVEERATPSVKMGDGENGDIFQLNKALPLVLYSLVSVFLVFLNKQIFVGDFSYPLFTTWVQQVCGMSCYLIAYVALRVILGNDRLISRPTLLYGRARDCFPMSVACTIFILLSNLCLKYVPMASYSITRSLTLFFNIVFSLTILKQRISGVCIFGCIVVTLGFVIGSIDMSSLCLRGILSGALSSFFQSIYTVQIKSVSEVIDDEFQVYWYNTLITSFLAIPPIFVFGEHKAFVELYGFGFEEFSAKFGPILVTGVLNFFLGVIIIWCIHSTSPIAYNLTGYLKSGIQTLIGVLINNEEAKLSIFLGLLMTIGGSAIYSFGDSIKLVLSKKISPSSYDKAGGKRADTDEVVVFEQVCYSEYELEDEREQEREQEQEEERYCCCDSDSTKSGAPSLEYTNNKGFEIVESYFENETPLPPQFGKLIK